MNNFNTFQNNLITNPIINSIGNTFAIGNLLLSPNLNYYYSLIPSYSIYSNFYVVTQNDLYFKSIFNNLLQSYSYLKNGVIRGGFKRYTIDKIIYQFLIQNSIGNNYNIVCDYNIFNKIY